MGSDRVNLDAAAGLPLRPAGRAALLTALDVAWADPRRRYREGRSARQFHDAARASLAAILGTTPDRVYFTSSGTAAIRLAMAGFLVARPGSAVLASAVEHSAVLAQADRLAGAPTLIRVGRDGRVDLEALAQTLAAGEAGLLAVQQVNGEVGTRQPLVACHELARSAGVPLLVDASAGLPVLGPPASWDALVASAHKWGGPAGVGVLALAPGTRWRHPAGPNADPGFPNVAATVSAAAALEDAMADPWAARSAPLTARLRTRVTELVSDVELLGPAAADERAPHLVSLGVLYADGESLVDGLDAAGFAVASGSACTADTRRPSHVLAAMGVMTHGNLRFSLAPEVRADQVAVLLGVLPGIVAAARAQADRMVP